MLFNSVDFLIFFPCVCILYFIFVNVFRSKKNKDVACKVLLLSASLFFYAYANVAHLGLILISVCITFASGILMEKYETKKTLVLTLSLVLNLAVLFFFKYFVFVVNTVYKLSSFLGISYEKKEFNILLPVGISFYTFQALGYSIDVYKQKIKAEKNFLTYALFVTFFPQLVAGPIERSENLLPQFNDFKNFEYKRVTDGLKLATWGMFKKIVVADSLAIYVNGVYSQLENCSSLAIVLATVFFSFQILCDFSGYSDIAIGVAKVLGFDLMKNFNRPYFSKSIAEFWRRWHISLSTWFKDYVYFPLGGSRCKKLRHLFNLFVTFLISGLWHGASWHFVIWGALHGLYQIIGVLTKNIKTKIRYALKIKETSIVLKCFRIVVTFCLVTFAWIFFRVEYINEAIIIIRKFSELPNDFVCIVKGVINFFADYSFANLKDCIKEILFTEYINKITLRTLFYYSVYLLILFVVDLKTRTIQGTVLVSKYNCVIRTILYLALFYATVFLGNHKDTNFIYFTF